MIIAGNLRDPRLIDTLGAGGLAVLRTDTIYGIVARADIEVSVERIFTLKQRSPDKPLIVLVASTSDIPHADDTVKAQYRELCLTQPTSIIIPNPLAPSWLTREQGSVAYRVPQLEGLRKLITQTGPLVAPSANPQGLTPATGISQAIDYFGDLIDVYVDSGEVSSDTRPSRIVSLHKDTMHIVR